MLSLVTRVVVIKIALRNDGFTIAQIRSFTREKETRRVAMRRGSSLIVSRDGKKSVTINRDLADSYRTWFNLGRY